MKKPKGFKAFDALMRKLVKVPPGEVSRRQLTRAQRVVLERLATGHWVMDRHGRNGMQAIMSGPGKATAVISAKTVSSLFFEHFICPSIDGVTDFEITPEGRAEIS